MTLQNTDDQTLLIVNGQAYSGWVSVQIERGLDQCASSFTLECPESYLAENSPLPFKPFTPCSIRRNGVTYLTGYIFGYSSRFDENQNTANITGRSKTAQLVDCTPDMPSGQYLNYTLSAIANSLCGIFGVTAKIETSLAGTPLADATFMRGDTAFRFIDRQAAICGVLACDDAAGSLVITSAGTTRASGAIEQGKNVLSGQFQNNCADRFSQYIVKGQSGLVASGGGFTAVPGGGAAVAPGAAVQTQQRAEADDASVSLYRPKVIMAEGQLTQAQLNLRASWQRAYHFGQSISATIEVAGWEQPDGTPWQINQLIPVDVPALGAVEDLLILKTAFNFSGSKGFTTEITVGPIEGATPNPSLLKTPHRKKGKKGVSSVNWSGVGTA